MEGLTLNVVKSFVGKNVNLHLKDGSVIVNVQLVEVQKDLSKRQAFIKCIPYGNEDTFRIPLKSIAWVKLLDLNLIQIRGDRGS